MTISALESVPTEVLDDICQYLASDRRSLYTFTLVSKRCRAVGTVHLLQKIRISILSRKKLQRDVNRWIRTLPFWLGNVRCLTIEGTMPRERNDKGDLFIPEDYHDRRFHSLTPDDWQLIGSSGPEDEDEEPGRVIIDEDDAWRPLADLIQRLSSLEDLYYTCTNQFSPCLLEKLHRNLPRCRLHLRTFYLRSVGDRINDHYEFVLVTSPCLYSIATPIMFEDDQRDAIFKTIFRLAQNLKELYTRGGANYSWRYDDPLTARPLPPWPGFTLDTNRNVIRRGALTYLEFSRSEYDWSSVQAWSELTDFSLLQTLCLKDVHLDEELLSWMVERRPFKSLNTLKIEGVMDWGDMSHIELSEIFSSFISSLPPLKSLRLRIGHWLFIYESIFERHGSSLRHLNLAELSPNYFLFNVSLINELRLRCPQLEDLSLVIPRTKGDRREQNIYKALGAMPKLQTLCLLLDCVNRFVWPDPGLEEGEDIIVFNDPSFDDFDQAFSHEPDGEWLWPARNCHVRDALVNSALDDALARAIFQSVSTGRDHKALPLERLELCVQFGDVIVQVKRDDDWGPHLKVNGLAEVIQEIGRTWKVVRNVRDDCQGQVVVEELMSPPVHTRTFAREGDDIYPPAILPKLVKPVFQRLWPPKEGSKGWRDDWHSFPLSDE